MALEDYLGKVTVLPQAVKYQLADGQWAVEAVEKTLEIEDRDGNPVLLVRFYGTLARDKDKGDRLLSALIALKGLTQAASTMEIMNADWESMRRDVGP